MNIIFSKEPNVIFECAYLTYKIVNQESYKDKKSYYASKYQVDAELLESCFGTLSNISKEIVSSVKTNIRSVEELFKKNSLGSCHAFYLLHGAMMTPHADIYAAVESVKNISKAEFFLNFYSLLSMQDRKAKFDREVKNYNDLINFISSMTIPDEEKWGLCRFYNNFELNKQLLSEFMMAIGQAYFDAYDSMDSHIEHYISTMEAAIAEGGIKFINSNFGLALGEQINSVTVIPTVILGSDMKYMYNFTADTVDDALFVGGYYEPIGKLTGDGEKLRDLCGSLRTLGDASKLKILKILSTGPRYGLELSNMLGISTATVSHHVSLLEEYGFIVLDRKQNRVYYSINREKITELIDALETELS